MNQNQYDKDKASRPICETYSVWSDAQLVRLYQLNKDEWNKDDDNTYYTLKPPLPRLQNSRVFFPIRKARSAVSVILACEAREPHTLHFPSPFLRSLQTFRSNIDRVARVRKKYDCFAVYPLKDTALTTTTFFLVPADSPDILTCLQRSPLHNGNDH